MASKPRTASVELRLASKGYDTAVYQLQEAQRNFEFATRRFRDAQRAVLAKESAPSAELKP